MLTSRSFHASSSFPTSFPNFPIPDPHRPDHAVVIWEEREGGFNSLATPERSAEGFFEPADSGSGAQPAGNNNGNAPPPKKLFFPYSLNVEELYNRISGTSRYLGDDNRSDDGWHVTMVADNYPSPQIITSFF